jgi:predicted negative regulator of RcsB-dependent stress response
MKKGLHSPKDTIVRYLHLARKNAPFTIFVFLIAIYGFLSWRIVTLMQAEPDDTQVSAKLQTVGVPKVDPEVISKISQLEDNSVSVQTLFDQARQNPFSE